jgi:hypothetical protein
MRRIQERATARVSTKCGGVSTKSRDETRGDCVERTILGAVEEEDGLKEPNSERGWIFDRGFSPEEFGLEWFAFTSAIRFGQGRYSGHFHSTSGRARDVVQVRFH